LNTGAQNRMETNSPQNPATRSLLRRCRVVLGLFIVALILSGVTAFPLQSELDSLTAMRGLAAAGPGDTANGLDRWLVTVRDGLKDTDARYPWMAYGTDWLAFAHIVIAVFFIGPWMDPCRNQWVLQAGLIACALVLPLALIAGGFRGIPLGWRFIDCSFGIFGALPLWYCLRLSRRLQREAGATRSTAS
jgi:hypothetical protein